MSRYFRCLTVFAVVLVAFSQADCVLAKSGKKSSGSGNKRGSAAKTSSGTKAEPKLKKGFTLLFNGKDLNDWVRRGGEAEYTIEDGAIVGTSKPDTPNTFLCTKRNYANFILELELKVDNNLNSGIQIRSEHFDDPKTIELKDADGKIVSKKIPAKRVHGYQVEIDPSDRSWSGGIYDEARRGWLNNLDGEKNKAAREAFKRDEWNHYRIVARDNKIKTWVNGVKAANLEDDLTSAGFIALQVHRIGKKTQAGAQVRWRNIQIRELK